MSQPRGTILVAGASRGIGEQIARQLSAGGWKVVLAARPSERLSSVAESLPAAVAAPADFSKLDSLQGWFDNLVREHGPFSGLVYCAAVMSAFPLKDVEIPAMEEIFHVNTMAPILLAQAFRRPSAFCAPASIVFVTSIIGLIGRPALTVYGASKEALHGFVRSAALELSRQGIRINAVAPGMIETEHGMDQFARMSDAQRAAVKAAYPLGIGAPQDVAGAVTFLVSDDSKWITGTTLVVDGGYTAQ
jgi:NAD(P)-dependent dehydrogenase (short-subunit alcohol dehydrogenase family)